MDQTEKKLFQTITTSISFGIYDVLKSLANEQNISLSNYIKQYIDKIISSKHDLSRYLLKQHKWDKEESHLIESSNKSKMISVALTNHIYDSFIQILDKYDLTKYTGLNNIVNNILYENRHNISKKLLQEFSMSKLKRYFETSRNGIVVVITKDLIRQYYNIDIFVREETLRFLHNLKKDDDLWKTTDEGIIKSLLDYLGSIAKYKDFEPYKSNHRIVYDNPVSVFMLPRITINDKDYESIVSVCANKNIEIEDLIESYLLRIIDKNMFK